MKIALVSAFYPYRGGIAQFSAALLRVFQKKDKAKAFNFKRQYPSFLFPGKTQFVTDEDQAEAVDSERSLDSVNPFSYLTTIKKINAYQADLLLVNYWMTFFGFSKGFIAKKARCPKKIALLHNLVPHEKRFFDKASNRYFVKQFDGFVVLSNQVRQELTELKPDAKILLLEHPVYDHFGLKIDRHTAQDKLGTDPGKKTLLFFGLIRDYKGLDLLLEALALLDDSYQLIIAGECYGSFEKYQQLIDRHQLAGRILLKNKYINDDEVPVVFSASDVCVLPYRSATQSGIAAVANHFCLPMIATQVGGLHELIADQKDGLIVQEPEAKAISLAIQQYFTRNLKEKFQQELLEGNKIMSWEKFGEKIIEFAATV